MEALFLQILDMSISASWLIVAVILIRILMKKAPKGFRYVLWALVAVRLLCPTFIETDFSLIPSQDVVERVEEKLRPVEPQRLEIPDKNDVTNDMVQNDSVQNQDKVEQNDVVQNNATQNNGPQNSMPQNPEIVKAVNPITVVAWIWMTGILALLIYACVAYGKLRHTIRECMQREDGLWVCDGIQSPFILGLVRPQIYLPAYIEEKHIPYIVAHEKEHIRCKDNWWKPLGFLLLAVHWFNPLVWVAYILMCRDIELACDERVIRSMQAEDKKNYSKSLLLCSNPRHFISACPVAFGEVGVKERIKKIVDYRKPSVWIIGIGIVICLVMVFGFMTNPKEVDGVAKIYLRSPGDNNSMEITDEKIIARIVDGINDLILVPTSPSFPSGGWSYWITLYDEEGNEIDSLTLLGDNKMKGDYFISMSINGTFDTEYYDKLLAENKFGYLDELNGMTPLTNDELEWFSTKFFNNDENRITNMFLTSQYSDAKHINMCNLFYAGANGYGDAPVSEAEKQLLAKQDSYAQEMVYILDVAKTTRAEMEKVIQRYLGMELKETNQVHLSALYYLPEYDAYYNIAGDTLMSKYAFEKGWKDEQHNVVLEYYDALSGNETERYRVTLKVVNGDYCFVSNVSMSGNNQESGEMSENFITEEQLEWFETKFFNQEENRITNQFLTNVYGMKNEVDLYELFYNGSGMSDGTGEISKEEKQLLKERYIDDIYTDLVRVTRKEMDEILQKYLGISLEETSKVGLNKMYYLEEYDAYYMMHGDTNYNRYVFKAGKVNEDGSITLQYHSIDKGYLYWVTLIESDGSYHFVSNQFENY